MNDKIFRLSLVSVCAVLALAGGVSAAGPATATATDLAARPLEERFDISTSPDDLVLEFYYDIAMLEGDEERPRLQLWGDGRVVAHFPLGFHRAGTWEGRLDREEMLDLVGLFVQADLVEADLPALKRDLQRRERERVARAAKREVRLFEVSDHEGLRFVLHLEDYRAADALGSRTGPIARDWTWWALREDRGRHPHVEVLERLATIRDRLNAIAERSDLERLPEEAAR